MAGARAPVLAARCWQGWCCRGGAVGERHPTLRCMAARRLSNWEAGRHSFQGCGGWKNSSWFEVRIYRQMRTDVSECLPNTPNSLEKLVQLRTD